MPEIIEFSNRLCYSDTPLIPLRQYGPNRLQPLDHIYVQKGYREGDGQRVINRPEAEAIVQRIIDICSDPRYEGKTIGVIVLQGTAQAALIQEMLLQKIGAEAMENRRLICGEPYSFQGDERDIILLSMVAAPNQRIGVLNKPADERRFNVAASRARDQMILAHSVTKNDLGANCLRRRLLEFFTSSSPVEIKGIQLSELERLALRADRNTERAPKPFDSWFEVDVAIELLRRGYYLIPQFEVAGKYIDLVIEGGVTRLAVECDGDYWHGQDRFEEDMQRQRQLERCGWEFFRVREAVFYANRKDVLERLRRACERRGIMPSRSGSSTADSSSDASETNDCFSGAVDCREDKETVVKGEESQLAQNPLAIASSPPNDHPFRIMCDYSQDMTVVQHYGKKDSQEPIEIRTNVIRLSTKIPDGRSELPRLTRREIEVLELMALGYSNPRISKLLRISTETVKEHVQNILRKLGMKNRVEAALWAKEHGFDSRNHESGEVAKGVQKKLF